MKAVHDAPLTLGVPYVFRAPRDEVWSAAREVLVDSGLAIADEYDAGDSVSVVIGESGFSLLGYGHFVRLTVESHSDGTTSVRVFAKRKDGADKDYYTDEIILGIKRALK